MVGATKDHDLALLGEASRGSEGLEIGLGAGVCEADFGHVEAGAYGACKGLLGACGTAEVEADGGQDGGDGFSDDGGGVAVEGGGELAREVGVSGSFLEAMHDIHSLLDMASVVGRGHWRRGCGSWGGNARRAVFRSDLISMPRLDIERERVRM